MNIKALAARPITDLSTDDLERLRAWAGMEIADWYLPHNLTHPERETRLADAINRYQHYCQ